MPSIESVTPSSLRNLSLEEENNDDNEHKATSWEVNVARNVDSLPRSSSPYPKKKTHTLEDLETYTDDNMVDMTNFLIGHRMKRGLQDLNKLKIIQRIAPHHKTVPHIWQNCQYLLLNPTEMKSGESYQTREEYPVVGQLVSEGSHPG